MCLLTLPGPVEIPKLGVKNTGFALRSLGLIPGYLPAPPPPLKKKKKKEFLMSSPLSVPFLWVFFFSLLPLGVSQATGGEGFCWLSHSHHLEQHFPKKWLIPPPWQGLRGCAGMIHGISGNLRATIGSKAVAVALHVADSCSILNSAYGPLSTYWAMVDMSHKTREGGSLQELLPHEKGSFFCFSKKVISSGGTECFLLGRV